MVICKRCGDNVAVFNEIRLKRIPSNLCGRCMRLLKQYFERKNKTKGKDIQSCSCCRMFNEIVYSDGYYRFCYECLKNYCPELLPQKFKIQYTKEIKFMSKK